MTCNKQSGPIVGGVYEDPTIKNPTIIGGIATGITLVGPDINGGISMDDATASILAKILAPYLPELVSSLFKNCEGNALPPGTQLMSCAEILKEIELAICRGCGGGGSGTDIGDRITSFTFDSATRILTINVIYADNTTKAWTVTLPAGAGAVGDVIQNFVFDSATGTLTINVTKADGSGKDWVVDISSLTSPLELAPRVIPTDVTQLPLSIVVRNEDIIAFGSQLLGTPTAWARILLDGTTYKIPLYVAPPVDQD